MKEMIQMQCAIPGILKEMKKCNLLFLLLFALSFLSEMKI